MSFYEFIIIIRQDVSSVDIDKIINDLKKIIEDHKDEIIKTEYWGLRSLAYEIKNNKKGHYYFIGIRASKPLLDEINRKVKLSESIIRYSLVKVEEISKDVSPILKEKNSDNENTVDVTTKKS